MEDINDGDFASGPYSEPRGAVDHDVRKAFRHGGIDMASPADQRVFGEVLARGIARHQQLKAIRHWRKRILLGILTAIGTIFTAAAGAWLNKWLGL